MATSTLGTNANNSLTALNWNRMSAVADVATIANGILLPHNPAHPIAPGAFTKGGILYFPERRGWLALAPGDYIAIDSTGWPIVVSNESIASGSTSWTHS